MAAAWTRRFLPRAEPPSLTLSVYERVACFLIAALVLLGAVVFCLLIAWMGTRYIAPPKVPKPYAFVPVGVGEGQGNAGDGPSLDGGEFHDAAPAVALSVAEFGDTLSTLSATVATRAADFDEPAQDDQDVASKDDGKGRGKNGKDGRGAGEGGKALPPHKRWQIVFEDGLTLDEYAKRLDFFEIELGVLGAGEVIYLRHLAQEKPETRRGKSKDDLRLYLSWRSGKMKDADAELLKRAGVPPARLVLQFYPDELERKLLQLEHDYRDREASAIAKTRFGIRKIDDGFEFCVIDQTVRDPGP